MIVVLSGRLVLTLRSLGLHCSNQLMLKYSRCCAQLPHLATASWPGSAKKESATAWKVDPWSSKREHGGWSCQISLVRSSSIHVGFSTHRIVKVLIIKRKSYIIHGTTYDSYTIEGFKMKSDWNPLNTSSTLLYPGGKEHATSLIPHSYLSSDVHVSFNNLPIYDPS